MQTSQQQQQQQWAKSIQVWPKTFLCIIDGTSEKEREKIGHKKFD